MDQRVSLVTLGVRDLARARAFYEALGWRSSSSADDDAVFFQGVGTIIGLWGRDDMEREAGVEAAGPPRGTALALNVRSREAVDAIVEQARAAGATIFAEPAETAWGGYAGTFHDPDGHPWEVAHNPFWTIEEDGSIRLPE